MDVDSMNFTFLKYISSKKKYIFELVKEQKGRIDFLEIRVYFNSNFITCTLKSVYDLSLFEKNLSFHSDGIFNKHTYLFNSVPANIWFPESIRYRFDHTIESLKAALDLIKQNLTNQGRLFFKEDAELDLLLSFGQNYIDKLLINQNQLADELQKETNRGRFFQMIENETFKDLIEHLSQVWIFPKEDFLKDYLLEEKNIILLITYCTATLI